MHLTVAQVNDPDMPYDASLKFSCASSRALASGIIAWAFKNEPFVTRSGWSHYDLVREEKDVSRQLQGHRRKLVDCSCIVLVRGLHRVLNLSKFRSTLPQILRKKSAEKPHPFANGWRPAGEVRREDQGDPAALAQRSEGRERRQGLLPIEGKNEKIFFRRDVFNV